MGLLNLDYEKLMANPMLQTGLGILANNSGHYGQFAPAFGRGAMQGMQNAQGFAQAQQEALYRKQQMEQQKINADLQQKQFSLQNDKFLQEKQSNDRTVAALDRFKLNHPELADVVDIDAKTAMKAANPSLNTADPFFNFLATDKGYASGNARTGEVKLVTDANGQPIIKSSDSPLVRGAVKSAESGAAAAYKPNTDIDGTLTTDEQIAKQIYGGSVPFSQGSLPKVATAGNMTIPPAVQQQRDNKRLNILLAEQQSEGGAGRNPELDREIARFGGIKIPTAAELSAKKAAAEMKAETKTKAEINLPNVIQESENTVKLVDDLLKAPGFKQAVGGSRMFGLQNVPGQSAYDFDNRLEQLKGKQFLQAYESLKGAGAITDIEGTKAGNAISRMNASTSEGEFVKAANEFKAIIKQGAERAKAKAGNSGLMPKNEQMPAKRRVFNPKTGKIE